MDEVSKLNSQDLQIDKQLSRNLENSLGLDAINEQLTYIGSLLRNSNSEVNQLKIKIVSLEMQLDESQTKLNQLINSRVWKILKKINSIKKRILRLKR